MEKPLVTLVHQNGALSKLAVILQRFGLRVRMFSNVYDLVSAAKETKTGRDFIFLDRQSAEALTPWLKTGSPFQSVDGSRPLILVTAEKDGNPSAVCSGEFVELPMDLGTVHRFLQENHLIYGRRHLRVEIKLPSIYSHRGLCHVAEILSLGTGGAFIKSGWNHVGRDDLIDICIPLLGMQRELELEGSVVYQVDPSEENKYLQGFGVRFNQLEAEMARTVEDYIKFSLSTEFDDNRDGYEAANYPLPSHAMNRLSPSAREGRLCLKG